jgi:catechol 2,3-dioxygenase-like lactoylglutathione lyase family enzyme
MHLELVSLIVHDYDEAIAFFVDKLRLALVEELASPHERRSTEALGGGSAASHQHRATPGPGRCR